MTPIQLKQSNYLENDIIASYLNIFEYETYFTSIRYKDFSRKEYDKAINVLTNFLMKTNNDDAIYQLNEAIFSRRFEGDIYSPASNYYKSLNISKIENIALFNLDNTTLFFKELTFESIKKQYKKAAMRHHPDKGGSTEDMKKLNKLLIELNDYVKASTLDVVSSEVDEKYLLFGIKSFEDYYCLLNIILFNIYLDEWNAEKAYSTFKEIDDYYCKEKNEELFYVFYDETDYAYKLARILTIANMNIEALDVFNRANSALSSRNHYLAYKNIYLKLDSSKEEIKAIIKKAKRKCQDDLIGVINSIYGIKKLRFVINHFRKAENCYRLGIINQTQYKKSIDRLIKDHQVLMGKEIAVNDYLISELFASLPTCSSTPIQIKIHSNIEWPKYYAGEYYIRFNQLSDEQKNEYLKAFSKESTYELLCKYNRIRYHDIFESIVLFNDEIVCLNNIIKECELYIKLGGKHIYIKGHNSIIVFCKMLLTTNQHEKIKKLQIIKYIFLFFRGQSCWPKGNIKLSSYLSFDKQYLSNNKNNAIVKVNNENLFHWELDDIIKLFELTLDNLEKIKISLERKEITEISIHNLIISSIDQSYFNIDFEPFLISKYIYSLNFSFDNRRHLALTNEEDENHEIQVSGLLDMYSNDYFLIKYDRKDKHDFVAELYIRINNKTINIEFYSSLHISKITGKNNDIIEHSLKMIDKDYVGKYIFDKISTLIDGNEFEIAMKLFAMANFESNYFEPILVKHNQDSNDNTILQFIDSLRLIDLFKRNLPGDEAILHWPPRVINELNEL